MIPHQLVMPILLLLLLLLSVLLLRHRGGVLGYPVGMIGIHHGVVVQVEFPRDVDLEGSLHKQLLFS